MQNQKNMNLVLSTDAKPRLKWTPELHQRFIDAVTQLGGADKATPKSLMRVMAIPGLTLCHLKSHLQKYRLGKSQEFETCNDNMQSDYTDDQNGSENFGRELGDVAPNQIDESLKIAKALQMQMEVQRKLHEQIEVQRHLQLRIEAQGKYLHTVLKKAHETLAGCNSSTGELERARSELSQLASMVNTGSPSSPLSGLTEAGGSSLKQFEPTRRRSTLCSIESSLTSSESSGGEKEKLQKNEIGTKLPLMTSDVREVSGKSFDYIVVGGGTTGCALAATLSERFSVLLVERGGSPFKNPQVTEKKYYGLSLLKPDKYTSVAQDFVSKEGVQNLRGRVLGGSSAINGGFYSRASWDFVKKAGWDKGLVMNAYKWVESKIVFRPFLSPWQWVAEFGLLEAGILPCNGYSLEHIEGTKIGGTIFDEHGRRHTSADLLEAANINNIFVLLNATVKSVIFQKNGNRSRHIAHGIKFMKSHGSTHEVYEAYLKQPQNSSVRGDVILTAGAIGSPQILMLSGVGPFNHLKNFKIPLVLDLKGVGERMKDSPGVSVLVDPRPQNRLPDTPEVVGIAENLKYIIQTGILPISLNETRIPIAIKYSFPVSKGKLRLKSTDPRNNPSVSFNYLSNEKDLKECSKMTRLLQRVARTHSVAMFFGIKRNNKYMLSGENELIKFCKDNVRTFYHYFGGCTVGLVVDKDYKVYGVRGLRVVDGSTFLESPGTNPMATLLMLGRYQGIKILEERKHASGSTSH